MAAIRSALALADEVSLSLLDEEFALLVAGRGAVEVGSVERPSACAFFVFM